MYYLKCAFKRCGRVSGKRNWCHVVPFISCVCTLCPIKKKKMLVPQIMTHNTKQSKLNQLTASNLKNGWFGILTTSKATNKIFEGESANVVLFLIPSEATWSVSAVLPAGHTQNLGVNPLKFATVVVALQLSAALHYYAGGFSAGNKLMEKKKNNVEMIFTVSEDDHFNRTIYDLIVHNCQYMLDKYASQRQTKWKETSFSLWWGKKKNHIKRITHKFICACSGALTRPRWLMLRGKLAIG